MAIKIHLYALSTPSHRELRDRWFLPSIQDDFEQHLIEMDQPGEGVYRDPSFKRAVRRKVEVVTEALQRHDGELVLVSDVDVQFFAPVRNSLLAALADKDVVAQSDGPSGYCCGFVGLRANDGTRNLLAAVDRLLKDEEELTEQPAFNRCLPGSSLRSALLPNIFFGPGYSLVREVIRQTPYLWTPGEPLDVPEGIVMHHANWAISVEHKLAQLAYVADLVRKRKTSI